MYNNNSKNNPFKILGKTSGKVSYDDYSITSTYITMRDGVKIAATICIPKGLQSGEKVPTIMSQTRYMRAHTLNIPFRWIFNEVVYGLPKTEVLTSYGYAVIYIDVRGTGASFGTRPYPFSEAEIKDGADVVDWIIAQPWSNGQVVSNGISYSGSTAELLAVNNHPSVKAVMPGHAFFDPYLDVLFPGGCFCTM
ncbi:MAG: CocE/NonD family hydrolase, partial [Promethearchaeota archaeon]